MSDSRDPIAVLLAVPADQLRNLNMADALNRALKALLASRATVALFLGEGAGAPPSIMGRRYDLSCAWAALAGWENAWGQLCKQTAPLLAEARRVQSFGVFTSACEALRQAGLNAWLMAWTSLVAAPADDCPLAALGLAPWSAVEVRRIVEGCLARPGEAAAVAPALREAEEAEATAQLEIQEVSRYLLNHARGQSITVQYVTLDQAAALVSRSKRTLEKYKQREKNPLPSPDVEGGGGRPDEWRWTRIRPWLEQEFGRSLPEQYPSQRLSN
jgi:hypothetical protein